MATDIRWRHDMTRRIWQMLKLPWHLISATGAILSIPFWSDGLDAITAWLGANRAAATLLVVAGVVLTLWAQGIWRDFVALRDRIGNWLQDRHAMRLAIAASQGKAYHLRAYIRVPNGLEPPEPAYRANNLAAIVRAPWRVNVPNGKGQLWASTAFATPGLNGGDYSVLPPIKVKCDTFHAAFSPDGKTWHRDRVSDDAYIRFRLLTGAFTGPVPLDPWHARMMDWTPMLDVTLWGAHAKPFEYSARQTL